MGRNEKKTGSIFHITKIIRYKDSIGWIINSFLITLFLIISIGRLTIVGQFFDDVLFDFLFGWFKYIFYSIAIIFLTFYIFGRKILLNKSFIWFSLIFAVVLLWTTSSISIIADSVNNKKIPAWSIDNFITINHSYFLNWKNNSIFGTNEQLNLWGFNGSWMKPYSGGGFIGAIISSITSYLTIYGSALVSIMFSLIIFINFFLNSTEKEPSKKSLKLFRLFNYSNFSKERQINYLNDFNSNQVLHETTQGDITLQYSGIDIANIASPLENVLHGVGNNPKQDLGKTQIINFNSDDSYTTEFQQYNKSKQFNPKKAKTPFIKPSRSTKKWDRKSQMPEENKIILPDDYKERLKGLPVYKNAYGKNVTLEKAREHFYEQSSVTPFGIAGKTDPWTLNSKKESTNSDDNFKNIQNQSPKEMYQPNNNFDYLDDDYSEEDVLYHNSVDENFKKTAPNVFIHQEMHRSNNNSNPDFKNQFANNNKNINYRLPSITILDEPKLNTKSIEINKKEALKKGEDLNTLFSEFNINIKVKNIVIGPSITKFEIVLAPGVNVRKIKSIEENIKVVLKTKFIRIEAPIPGKSAIGVEVANAVPDKVFFSQIINDKGKSKLSLAIGKEVDGTPLLADLKTMPHLLIAGSTGSGKSVCINSIIASLLMGSKPSEVKILMIDPKKVELSSYDGIPHLLAPVVTDTNHANNALKKMVLVMEERYNILKKSNSRDIKSYNSKVKKSEAMPYIVIIIDELADLMMTSGKEVEDSIRRITQLARAAGIHLIVATQRPSTDVVTGVIKTNIPSRISFSVASFVDSKTILDASGAERLVGKGDMLYSPSDDNNFIRAQGAFINDREIQELINYTKNQQETDYWDEFLDLNDLPSEENGGSYGTDEFNDPMFERIKCYVIETQKASTSFIQRKFQIGYNRAARIIDYLEDTGVIGPANGTKPREVYISNYEQYN
ncbi:DNA translocase FtsK [Spiroplasma endosymbiont of Amphibalanus improvisus]|uniref:DNA translocase FtsK n=1 Tax=Spiroplasma endosymbiont of Amphibalanus improvisus TaxID=3066327 RepID=UPI00313DA80B